MPVRPQESSRVSTEISLRNEVLAYSPTENVDLAKVLVKQEPCTENGFEDLQDEAGNEIVVHYLPHSFSEESVVAS